VKFFLDNMISPKFARALCAVDRDVTSLRERFPQDTPDEEWLREIAEDYPVLITVDRHIRTRPLEREALSKSGLITLFLGPFFAKHNFRFWNQFVWLVRHWQSIEETARGLAKGSCMLLTQNGKMHPMSSPHR
jgi:hypothetical protein